MNRDQNSRLSRFQNRQFSNLQRAQEVTKGIVNLDRDENGRIIIKVPGIDEIFSSFSEASDRARSAGLTGVTVYNRDSLMLEGSRDLREFAHRLVFGNKKDNFEVVTRDMKPTAEFNNWLERNSSTALINPDNESNKIIQIMKNGKMLDKEETFRLYGKITGLSVEVDDQGRPSAKFAKRFKQYTAQKDYEARLTGIKVHVSTSYTGQEGAFGSIKELAEEEWKALQELKPGDRNEKLAKLTKEQYIQRRLKGAADIASDGGNYAGRDVVSALRKSLVGEIESVQRLQSKRSLDTTKTRESRRKLRVLQKNLAELDDKIKRGEPFIANERIAGRVGLFDFSEVEKTIATLENDVKNTGGQQSPYFETLKDLRKQLEKLKNSSVSALAGKGNLILNPGDRVTKGIRANIQNLNREAVQSSGKGLSFTLSSFFHTGEAVLDLETASTWKEMIDENMVRELGQKNMATLVNDLKSLQAGGPPPPSFMAMIEQMESSADLATKRKGKQLRKFAQAPNVSLSSDPNVLESAMRNMIQFHRHKPGQAKIFVPGAISGEIISADVIPNNATYGKGGKALEAALKGLKKEGVGHARLVSGLGWVINPADAFEMYAPGGGFDFDDAFVGAARWRKNTKSGELEMMLPFLRRPNSRGEYSLLKTSIHDMSVLDSLKNAKMRGHIDATVFGSFSNARKGYSKGTESLRQSAKKKSRLLRAQQKDVDAAAKEVKSINAQLDNSFISPALRRKLEQQLQVNQSVAENYRKNIREIDEEIRQARRLISDSKRVMEKTITESTDIFGDGKVNLAPRRKFAGKAEVDEVINNKFFSKVGKRYGLENDMILEYSYDMVSDVDGKFIMQEGKKLRFKDLSGERTGVRQMKVADMTVEQLRAFTDSLLGDAKTAAGGLLGQSVNADIFMQDAIARNANFLRDNGLGGLITKTTGFEPEDLIDALAQTGLDPRFTEAVEKVRKQNVFDALEMSVVAVAKARDMGDTALMKQLGFDQTYFEEGKIASGDVQEAEDYLKKLLDTHKLTRKQVMSAGGTFKEMNSIAKKLEEMLQTETRGLKYSANSLVGLEGEELNGKRKLLADIRSSKQATRDAEVIQAARNKFITEMDDLKSFGVEAREIYEQADRITLQGFANLFDSVFDESGNIIDTRAGERAYRAVIRSMQMVDEEGLDPRMLRALSYSQSPYGEGIDLAAEAHLYAKNLGNVVDFSDPIWAVDSALPEDELAKALEGVDRGFRTMGSAVQDQVSSLGRRESQEVLRRILEGPEFERKLGFLESMTRASESMAARFEGEENTFRDKLRNAGFAVDDGEAFAGPLSPDARIVLGDEFDRFYGANKPQTMGELLYDYQRGGSILSAGDERIEQTRLSSGVRRDFGEFQRTVEGHLRTSMDRFSRAAMIDLSDDVTSSASYASWAQGAMRDSGLDPTREYGVKAKNEAAKAASASSSIIETIKQRQGFGGLMAGIAESTKPIRGAIGLVAAGLTAAGVIRTMKTDDHTIDDIQGPVNRPGGNPYSSGQEVARPGNDGALATVKDIITGDRSATRAARYVIRATGLSNQQDNQTFLNEVAAITGQQVNFTSGYAGSDPRRRNEELQEILGSYR